MAESFSNLRRKQTSRFRKPEEFQTNNINAKRGIPRYIIIKMSKVKEGASLVAQWLRTCLPMQGTQVRALVWEDPTCHGANGPVSHNY